MSSINHKYCSSVERQMLADQKVRGSILQHCIVFVVLYEFTRVLDRIYKGKHEFKTREVHEKGS